jgi:hypothetical protein
VNADKAIVGQMLLYFVQRHGSYCLFAVCDNITFVICKATEGVKRVDTYFRENRKDSREKGFTQGETLALFIFSCRDKKMMNPEPFMMNPEPFVIKFILLLPVYFFIIQFVRNFIYKHQRRNSIKNKKVLYAK